MEPVLKKGEGSSFVISQRDLVFLDPSNRIWADSEEFVQKSRRVTSLVSQDQHVDAIEEFHQASSLYRGEFLEDEPYSD